MTPDYADVARAAERLKGVAVRTPLIELPAWAGTAGAQRVFVKAEPLQHLGAFKFRGAYNKLVQLSQDERRRGVVAWSSGNHAQAVAYAARLLGIRAAIVMPATAPRMKRERTAALGAEVVLYDPETELRETVADRLLAARGAVAVPPYDDPQIIAGQGTLALEAMEDLAALGLSPDDVLVPVSGGGLVAGVCLAVHAHSPGTRIFSVEPEGWDDTALSLAAGTRVEAARTPATACDALMVPIPGRLTFAINSAHLSGGLAVSEVEIAAAMRFAFESLKIVLEPGGAVALAAHLAGRLPESGRARLLILSGGNVDADRFVTMLRSGS